MIAPTYLPQSDAAFCIRSASDTNGAQIAASTGSGQFNITAPSVSGYTPIGVLGIKTSAASLLSYRFSVVSNTNTIRVSCRNLANSAIAAGAATVTVSILYAKTDMIANGSVIGLTA